MNHKSVFLLESDDDPHLLTRLVGMIVRRGGRVQALSCVSSGDEMMKIELEIVGGRTAFLQANLKKTEGVKRVDLAQEGFEMPKTDLIGG